MAIKIGEMLLKKGVISEKDLLEAERIQRQGDPSANLAPGERLGRIIIRKKFSPAMEVLKALCEQRLFDDYILVDKYIVSPSMVSQVPQDVARRFSVLPLVSFNSGVNEAVVAATQPPTPEQSGELEKILGLKVDWVEIEERNLPNIIDRVYAVMAERGAKSVRIGEALIREGLITAAELEWALSLSRKRNIRLGKILAEEGLVTEAKFYAALARNKRLPLVKAVDILANKESAAVATRLSRTYAIFNEVVPFRLEGDKLSVAASDAEVDLSELRKIYNCRETSLCLVTITDMLTLLKGFYGLEENEAREKGLEAPADKGDLDVLCDLDTGTSDSSIDGEELKRLRQQYERLVNNLLNEAIRRRASDIHIEAYENFVVVRLRIDGLLYDTRTLHIDKTNVSGVVNAIKVLSDINIAERRVPQGGRFKKRTSAGLIFDFRVSVQPTLFGENVVIRLLNQSASIVPLTDLGFSKRSLEHFLQVIENPSGLVLITGPTGSGKTTTLYSTLDLLRKDTTKKIVTIEDPVEYSLPRIQQSQTHDLIGYTFAAATRSFLRQDPDIALVGEVRDEETARETIKLSQTGHLVFSTLHTNTAASAASRLFVLGVDPELLAGELLVVMAQRLARKICPSCRVAYKPKEDVVRTLYPDGVPEGVTFYKGNGCPKCDGLGHKGRVALAEIWFVDHDSRLLISKRADEDTILKSALGISLFPILADALEKVQNGVIDISELPTVLPMASISATARLIRSKGLLDFTKR